jgi:hypothetical protein
MKLCIENSLGRYLGEGLINKEFRARFDFGIGLGVEMMIKFPSTHFATTCSRRMRETVSLMP